MKKLIVTLFCVVFTASYAYSVTINEMENGEYRKYKIKRLVSELYDKKLRMNAQRILPSYGKEVTQYVLPLLDDKNNEFARIAALNVIENVADTSVELKVIEMLKDRDKRVKRAAAKALSQMGSDKSVEYLKELLKAYEPETRFNALRALARIAPKDELNLFIASLGDYDPRVRKFAVIAIGNLNAQEAVQYLKPMAQDFDVDVRYEVARTLGIIRTPECLEILTWMTQDPDFNVRLLALNSIGDIGGPESDTLLKSATESSDPRIIAKAIRELGKKKSPLALETAREFVNDEHIDVRLASIEVIGISGAAAEKATLEPLLEAESTAVRKEAGKAISAIEARI